MPAVEDYILTLCCEMGGAGGGGANFQCELLRSSLQPSSSPNVFSLFDGAVKACEIKECNEDMRPESPA